MWSKKITPDLIYLRSLNHGDKLGQTRDAHRAGAADDPCHLWMERWGKMQKGNVSKNTSVPTTLST